MRPSEGLRHRAEQLAAVLPPLLVAAERVAQTVSQGVHGRRRVGQGEAFWQFRRYEPGDPAQAIDWRQSAKRERVFVRQNEWEAAQSVWLWRDGTASMRYRSALSPVEKGERATVLLLALAVLLVRAGEHVALHGEGFAPSAGRGTIERLALALSRGDSPGDRLSLPGRDPLPRHARLVLIGDFLVPIESVAALAASLAARGVRGHVLQVLDPAEETLPFVGRNRFEGLEGDGEVLVRRTERLREAYGARMGAHQAALREIARTHGWTFAVHRTDRPPQAALLALYTALAEAPGM